jgi:hypothetical protein
MLNQLRFGVQEYRAVAESGPMWGVHGSSWFMVYQVPGAVESAGLLLALMQLLARAPWLSATARSRDTSLIRSNLSP